MGQTECKACIGANPSHDTVKIDAATNETLLTAVNVLKDQRKECVQERCDHPSGIHSFSDSAKNETKDVTHERGNRPSNIYSGGNAKEPRWQREDSLVDRVRLEEERFRIQEEGNFNRTLSVEEKKEREKTEHRAWEEQRLEEAARREAVREQAFAEAEANAKKMSAQAAHEAEIAKATRAAAAAELDSLKRAQHIVDYFLRARGFKSISTPRKKCLKTNYPLHVAVEDGNVDVVKALLKRGADKKAKNSSGQTPLDVAKRLNKSHSHDAVVAALSFEFVRP